MRTPVHHLRRPRSRRRIRLPFVIAGLLVAAVAAEAAESEVEISPETESRTPLGTFGIHRHEVAGLRLTAFLVGSFSYNSHIQMVPEFSGGAPALADPKATNARFDKLGLLVARTFASWLSASAAIEVENHRDRHTHGFNPGFGCPAPGEGEEAEPAPPEPCTERFGSEEAENEINLDRFNMTGIVPIGNGLGITFGRVDVPFGFERHDEPLLLTATTSEVFRFGRPDRMTGFQGSYTVAPWLDLSAWAVNRWENEASGDEDFNDDNQGKSFGGRLGLTPVAREQLLNFGFGGFVGPEQEGEDSNQRWVLDLDYSWSPSGRFLLTGEFVYGGEDERELRERGIPFPAPAGIEDVNWWGTYVLAHYDLEYWLGLSLRYGYFDDLDGGRTGVEQVLQSVTVAPIVHLSRLLPGLSPTGSAYARTRHPIDWVDLKLEYRFNRSDEDVFSDAEPGEDILEADESSHQFQLQVVANF